MTENDSVENFVTIDKDSIAISASYLAKQLSLVEGSRNHRAWDIYKEIVANSGVHHNFDGSVGQQKDLIQIATFALSAVECFEEAVEDYDS
ncbi:hypothetical protein [Okeania sp. KiyG1]|uniref:hypothetical protein n=1 Tax=Okeania sp. KiyG1 TaxID=2720165 RepID=UPI001922B9D2|nr:hypothetical protein [Okeania sp. KiyG1]GGA01360.1 hypothetical protein CYANOKiyG1_13150 [Okeania sp. KiyG1]